MIQQATDIADLMNRSNPSTLQLDGAAAFGGAVDQCIGYAIDSHD